MKNRCFTFLVVLVFFVSCSLQSQEEKKLVSLISFLPESIASDIKNNKKLFLSELVLILENDDKNLLVLVDKKSFLSSDYVPDDLYSLKNGKTYVLNREGLSLRLCAEQALEEMAQAAKLEGVTLLVSSTYRSFEYQKNLYERNVRILGQKEADRESARPGTSQHQLGTAVDFGSITDAFAQTKAGVWMAKNAHRFGWSLSYPDGYESLTGYRWESWHYRYLGEKATAFEQKWFGGVQQYMLEFIAAWKE